MNIKRLVRPNINSLSAYQAKEIACKVKLDANESPYGFEEIYTVLKTVKTNRYPDPEAAALKNIIAKNLKVSPENILQGNGSDELIYYLITTFGGPVLFPVPTFSMYGIISQALGEKRIEMPLNEEFDLDLKMLLPSIRKEKPKLIFLSSPNNPTGNRYSSEKILKIIESTPKALVIVDEAYEPFASEKGFVPLLKDYENLIIMRTLSKVGLAALRVGFIIAKEEIIREVNKVRLPFNVNSLSQTIAAEVLRRKSILKQKINSIITERNRLFDELSKINGVIPYPSEANFILFRVKEPDRIYTGLLNRGVLVRNMRGVVDGCLRVTVGTPEENKIFVGALRKAIRDDAL